MNSFIEFMNDGGEAFVHAAGLMFIQSSVLITILFGLDRVLRKHMRAVFRYWLWMLVLIKLVLPSSLSMPFSLGYWLNNAVDVVEASLPGSANPPESVWQGVSDSSLQVVAHWADDERAPPAETSKFSMPPGGQHIYTSKDSVVYGVATQPTAPLEPIENLTAFLPTVQTEVAHALVLSLTWQGALLGLWMVICTGAGCLVLQRTLLVQKLVRQGRSAQRRHIDLFVSCCKRMNIGRHVELRILPMVPVPAVYGLFRPVVLIPERMVEHGFGNDELKVIFIHELAHIQRGDLWVKLLQTTLQVVYFYNPLIWLANVTIRRVREQAVDETVLVALGERVGEVYLKTLLKVAGWAFDQPTPGLRLIGVMESKSLLSERIRTMLSRPIPNSKKISLIGTMPLVLLGVFLLPMARANKIGSASEDLTPVGSDGPQGVKASASNNVKTFIRRVPAADILNTGGERLYGLASDEAVTVESPYIASAPDNGSSMPAEWVASKRAGGRGESEITKREAEIEAIKLQINLLQQQLQEKVVALQKKQEGLQTQHLNESLSWRWRNTTSVEPYRDLRSDPPKMRRSTAGGTRSWLQDNKAIVLGLKNLGGMLSSPLNIGQPLQIEPAYDDSTLARPESATDEPRPSPYTRGTWQHLQTDAGYEDPLRSRPVNASDELRNELREILPELLRQMLPTLLQEAMSENAGMTNRNANMEMSLPSRSTTPDEVSRGSRTVR